jgi:hypothetical protein
VSYIIRKADIYREAKAHTDILYAKHLLDTALYFLQARTEHAYDCPRSRDDFECTCGLSDLKHSIREFLK